MKKARSSRPHAHRHTDRATHRKLDAVQKSLDALTRLVRRNHMAESAQITAFRLRVEAATNELASDLKALRDKIAAGTPLTPEDMASLDGIATQLEAMGVDPADPIPGSPA
jgi:hypothetical protein